jgi:anti-sigma regulatory factor (Ser/Thr protein kinase)
VLEQRLPAAPEAPAVARRQLRQLPLDEETLGDLSLLVSEVVTNAVRHACEADGAIELRVEPREDRVRVEVIDPGEGFEWKGRAATDPRQPGGWGLVLVDRLADAWGVERGERTRVWFEVWRPQRRAGALRGVGGHCDEQPRGHTARTRR